MKVKPFLTNILILFALILATVGTYGLGRLLRIDTQPQFTTSTYGSATLFRYPRSSLV
jgi:hypothetical protein